MADVVLVVGGERMREVTAWKATDFVATLTHPEAEYAYGLTLPAFAGIFTRAYMERYGLDRAAPGDGGGQGASQRRAQPVRPHRGVGRAERHLGRPASRRGQPDHGRPAAPVRLLPGVRRGRCGHALRHGRGEPLHQDTPIRIAGIGQATDTHCVHNREPTCSTSRRCAWPPSAPTPWPGSGRRTSRCAELHDAFLILEVAISRRSGSSSRARRKLAIERGETEIRGKRPDQHLRRAQGQGAPGGRHRRRRRSTSWSSNCAARRPRTSVR